MKDTLAMNAWCWWVIVIAPLFYSAYIVCSPFLPKDLNVDCRVVLENTEIMCAKWLFLSFTLCAWGLLFCSCPAPSLVFTLLLYINCEKRKVSHPSISWRAAKRGTSINGSNYDDAWCYCCACNMLWYHCCSVCLSRACKMQARCSLLQFCNAQHISAICRKIEN